MLFKKYIVSRAKEASNYAKDGDVFILLLVLAVSTYKARTKYIIVKIAVSACTDDVST